jgi:hypothetical protein
VRFTPTDAVSAGAPAAVAVNVAQTVHEQLATYRRDLYQGRGRGITEEWLRNTSLRPRVGGIPTAASREELHLRTMRARGELAASAEEATWAAAQFAGDRIQLGALASKEHRRISCVARAMVTVGLLGAALWRAHQRATRTHSAGGAR